jgi:O-methyltransferase
VEPEVGSVQEVRDLYIELLIGSLTHTLYAGVDAMEIPEEARETFTEWLTGSEDAWIVFDAERARAEGRDWPVYGQTMVGLDRMRNVRWCVETALADGIPGDLIEAGAWRGGVAILMRGVLKAYGVEDRLVWVADSFGGLPAPDPDRYPADRNVGAHRFEPLAVTAEEVRENFRRYGLLDGQVRFVEGWFQETLPELHEVRASVVHVDADMYGSTMEALVNLYDGLSPGGFTIIDDYALSPCREAVEDFRRDRGIHEPIEQVDWTGVYWRKPR